MKRIFFEFDIGMVGADGNECLEVDEDLTAEDLDQMAYEMAVDWAESYGVYPCDGGDGCEGDECESDHDGVITGWWVPYDPEKHDMLKPGGGEWFKD